MLSAATAILLYLVYKKHNRSYYTASGQWLLKWNVPAVGTQPISYKCVIVDDNNTAIVNSLISTPSILLDPTLFVPDTTPGALMSDATYKAHIIPTNAAGDGNEDVLAFTIFDTPTLIIGYNTDTETAFYPVTSSNATAIFDIGTTITLPTQMYIVLKDRVTADNLVIKIVGSQTYTPKSIATSGNGVNATGSADWRINWDQSITFTPGDKITFSITSTNAAGTFTWSNIYTVPPPLPTLPGNVVAQLSFT